MFTVSIFLHASCRIIIFNSWQDVCSFLVSYCDLFRLYNEGEGPVADGALSSVRYCCPGQRKGAHRGKTVALTGYD